MTSVPQIVLLGRPNVGKSTLFNRLIRSNRAITHDRPGITRDRLEGIVTHKNTPLFTIVDTGGLTLSGDARVSEGPLGIRGFEQAIYEQARRALESAQAIALVVDGQDGLLPMDEYLAQMARETGLPTLCVVNKVDGQEKEAQYTADFHRLGLSLLAVSAAHGWNINALIAAFMSMVKKVRRVEEAQRKPQAALRIAFLGRPNAGKSSLVNALTGEERMIISEIAGTTRDSVDVRATIGQEEYVFVDTAGVRRKTKITDTVERYSVNASLKSTSKADVTFYVLDCTEGLGVQDKRLLDLLATRKTPFIILLNKKDLIRPKELEALRKELPEQLSFCSYVPIFGVSAKTGEGLKKLLPAAKALKEECALRVPTGQLNRAMEEILAKHQPPIVQRARPRFFYMTQAESEPPTFVFFVSDATRVSESYLRYLERSIRKLFSIAHAPIRMHLRSVHKSRPKK